MGNGTQRRQHGDGEVSLMGSTEGARNDAVNGSYQGRAYWLDVVWNEARHQCGAPQEGVRVLQPEARLHRRAPKDGAAREIEGGVEWVERRCGAEDVVGRVPSRNDPLPSFVDADEPPNAPEHVRHACTAWVRASCKGGDSDGRACSVHGRTRAVPEWAHASAPLRQHPPDPVAGTEEEKEQLEDSDDARVEPKGPKVGGAPLNGASAHEVERGTEQAEQTEQADLEVVGGGRVNPPEPCPREGGHEVEGEGAAQVARRHRRRRSDEHPILTGGDRCERSSVNGRVWRGRVYKGGCGRMGMTGGCQGWIGGAAVAG